MLDLPAEWRDAALASSTLGARHRDWWMPLQSLKNLNVENLFPSERKKCEADVRLR
jgi:hypothetical protein